MKDEKVIKIKTPFLAGAIDDFMSSELLRAAAMSFPPMNWEYWHKYNDKDSLKFVSIDRQTIPLPAQKALDHIATHFSPSKFFDFNSNEFPDLQYYAGGMHMLPQNGFLGMHIDTDIHGGNLIWKREYSVVMCISEEYDSSFDLLLHNGKEQSSVPYKFNRLMTFKCSENSWHGVPEPITKGLNRKTLAVFFWSKLNKRREVKRTRSFFRHNLLKNISKKKN